jgi:hypothetical protein
MKARQSELFFAALHKEMLLMADKLVEKKAENKFSLAKQQAAEWKLDAIASLSTTTSKERRKAANAGGHNYPFKDKGVLRKSPYYKTKMDKLKSGWRVTLKAGFHPTIKKGWDYGEILDQWQGKYFSNWKTRLHDKLVERVERILNVK